jgi:serine/threonine protein kinase
MDESMSSRELMERLAEEFAERYRHGERPSVEEYVAAHPEHAAEIRELFPALVLLEELGPGDDSARSAPASPVRPDVPPREQLGDYRILREIGRGGMGVVYEAVQQSLGRRVALKVLPVQAAADARVLTRFRRESRAAAGLHHTNIVPVFDVGREGDVCYFAMQFIQGHGLDQVLKEVQRLRAAGANTADAGPVAQSLWTGRFAGPGNGVAPGPGPGADADETERLAGPAAPAVLAAQSELSGVESNYRRYCRNAVRIGLQVAEALAYAHARGVIHRDVKPSNLLLDTAGVAWVSDFGLAQTEEHGLTEPGEIVGTLRYMAPERFRGECDARADVYSLGLTLYELVLLRPAFNAGDRLRLVEEIMRQEPARPRAVDRRVPRDLETIVLKAIEKAPERRYPTADALADDLRHFLADEPIQARRRSPLERLGRWCRRRPAVASLVAALAVVLVSALVSVTGLWLRADRMRHLAETKQTEAENNWEESTIDFKLARESVDAYATRVSNNLKLRQDDLRPLRKELLETVVPFYEKLLARHSENADLQVERAQAYARLASITREIEDPAKACTLYEQAAAIFEKLSAQHPDSSEYPAQLATLRTDLGETYQKIERPTEAEAAFQASRKLWQGLAEQQPNAVEYQLGMAQARIGLAGLYGVTERKDAARVEYQGALRIQEELEGQGAGIPAELQRAFGLGHRSLGMLYSQAEQWPQAEPELKRALKIQVDLLRQDSHVSDYTQDLSKTRIHLGNLYWKTERLTEAESEFLEAMRLGEELVRQQPSVLQYPEYLADSRHAFALFYKAIKQPSRAVEEWQKALDTLEELPAAARNLTANQERLATIHDYRGDGLLMIGKGPEAVLEHQKAIRILKALRQRHPDKSAYQKSLIDSHTGLGMAHVGARQFAEAEAEYQNAVEISKALAPQDLAEREVQSLLSRCYNNLAILYYETERKSKCEEAHRESLQIAARLVRQYPENAYYQTSLAKSHNNLAVLCVEQGRPTEGMEEYRQALAITQRLVGEHPRVTEYSMMLGTYNANLGILQRNNGHLESALATFASAIQTLEGVLEKEPQHARARTLLCNAHWDRARTLSKLARLEPAFSDWQRALDLDDGKRHIHIRAGRAATIAQSGDHARAIAEVEELAGGKDVKPGLLSRLGFACAHASVAVQKDDKLPAGERADLAERYAARAVAFLNQAHAGGHLKNVMFLREFQTDTDLDPLRKRADFLELLAEVEREASPGKKP